MEPVVWVVGYDVCFGERRQVLVVKLLLATIQHIEQEIYTLIYTAVHCFGLHNIPVDHEGYHTTREHCLWTWLYCLNYLILHILFRLLFYIVGKFALNNRFPAFPDLRLTLLHRCLLLILHLD